MDQNSLYSTIKTHSKLENSEANTLAMVIWGEVLRYGKFWEKDGKKSGAEAERKKADTEIKKLEEQIAILKSEKAEMVKAPKGGELTKEQVVSMIRESAENGNAASQKILSDYIGLGKHEEDMTIQMVDFSDAPDWYKTKGPE